MNVIGRVFKDVGILKKDNNLIHKIGLILLVAGIVLDILQRESNYGRIIAWVGAIIGILTNPYKGVCICPECGTEFENQDKITIALNRSRILATCPKCKKTNFCRRRYIKNFNCNQTKEDSDL